MNIQLKTIDRTVFERLRLAVVEAGMYPDITKYNTRDSFEAEKQRLRDSGVDLVEPVGVGSWPSKDERTVSKIVLLRRRIIKGGLSGHGCTFYKGMYKVIDGKETLIGNKEKYLMSYTELNYAIKSYMNESNEDEMKDAYYKKFAYPSTQKSVEYDIRILCNTAAMERKLIDLVSRCLGQGKLVTGLVDDEGNFDCKKQITVTSSECINMTNGRMIEWSFQCYTNYVWLDEPKLIKDRIPLMRKVTGSVVITPDVNRPHEFGKNGNYLIQEDEFLVPIDKKNL